MYLVIAFISGLFFFFIDECYCTVQNCNSSQVESITTATSARPAGARNHRPRDAALITPP
ncbi:hypothetical protein PR003_g15133 [Phytophthora rubi]|uniref:Secreted protein n=1 Tax=Phytophthora rubi TaxID=129364 RepID=A0A6A4F0U1_9STRA|nr:hypothetical protein PR002_g16324 [Phytophthora rubi]KAE9011456.1 hypothetical protein PR001_g15910 [Phytophthora rubi]KAE9331181.1 hypothetical protein PR003_g15133 [Phytophthora rubi]